MRKHRHICPLCGRKHRMDIPPEPAHRPCIDCMVDGDYAAIAMNKDDVAYLMDVLLFLELARSQGTEIEGIDYECNRELFFLIGRQSFPRAKEIINHTLSRKMRKKPDAWG